MGFSETNLSGQLARLHEQVAKTIAAPAQGTHNTGVELEAVVQTTEAAAHQIMEAAEAISDCLRATVSDKAAIAAINSKIDAIFEACAFQDITGQRVRRAIEQLQTVESALSTMMAPIDAESDAAHQETEEPACTTGPELPQADVDALFAA
jgi:chemotaxis protein CheZ